MTHVGYIVYSSDIRQAALYNLDEEAKALDAATRWGAKMANVTLQQPTDSTPTPPSPAPGQSGKGVTLEQVMAAVDEYAGLRAGEENSTTDITPDIDAARARVASLLAEAPAQPVGLTEAAIAACAAVVDEPHGCVFCDSGKLRNPAKPHEEDCGFALAAGVVAFLRAVDQRHDSNSPPLKYTIPYGALNKLREILAAQPVGMPQSGEPVGVVYDRNGGHDTPSLPPVPEVAWIGGIPAIGTKLYAAPRQEQPTQAVVEQDDELSDEEWKAVAAFFARAASASAQTVRAGEFVLHLDPSIPPGEVRFIQGDKEVGRIVNAGIGEKGVRHGG